VIDKVILGTAQFGLDYGINNKNGQIPKKEVFKILDFCLENGIRRIDTAGVYGNAETLIGEYINHNKGVKFEITTKIKKDSNSLNDEIEKRLNNLNVEFIEELLFHSLDDYYFYRDQIQTCPQDKSLSFARCGVSLYSNDEIREIIDIDYFTAVQLPFNMFDNINHRGEVIKELKNKKFNISLRSIFLQGLFFMDLKSLPENLKPLEKPLKKIKKLIKKYEVDTKKIAINYCLKQNVNGIIIGCDSLKQLKEIIDSTLPVYNDKIFDEIDAINILETDLIDPRYW